MTGIDWCRCDEIEGDNPQCSYHGVKNNGYSESLYRGVRDWHNCGRDISVAHIGELISRIIHEAKAGKRL